MRLQWRRRWWLWALALIPVGWLAAVECLYRLALPPASMLPPRPAGPTVPPLVAQALWAKWEQGSAPMRIQPQGPWALTRWVASVFLGPARTRRPPDGSRLANFAALLRCAPPSDEAPSRFNGPQRFALGLWMTREWSAEELLAFHAEQMRVGSRVQGIWAASHVYLGREWTRLDVADAALLVSISDAPDSRKGDPWCHTQPTLARRDHLLRALHRQGFIDEQALEAALQAPLRLAPRPSTRSPCPTASVTNRPREEQAGQP